MKTAFGDDEFNEFGSHWYNRHCLEQKISHFVIKYASQCQILHQKSKTNVIKSKYIVNVIIVGQNIIIQLSNEY